MLEFMVPDCTSSPLATLFVIPFVVVIPSVAINCPPDISIVFWVIAPDVVVPDVIFVVPVEFEILTRLFIPVKFRVPVFDILAPIKPS